MKVTIEIDLSFDEVLQKPYIGHSKEIYNLVFDKFFVGDFAKNISFEELIEYLNKSDLNVVFDCKSNKVLQYLVKKYKNINLNNAVFHAFVDEWCFDKNNRRHKECIKLGEIKNFKNATNTLWIGSSLVKNYGQVDMGILETISHTGKGIIDGISFFTRYYELLFPRFSIYKIISNKGYTPVFASDLLFKKPDFQYVGVSNFINNCTNDIFKK